MKPPAHRLAIATLAACGAVSAQQAYITQSERIIIIGCCLANRCRPSHQESTPRFGLKLLHSLFKRIIKNIFLDPVRAHLKPLPKHSEVVMCDALFQDWPFRKDHAGFGSA